jgi:methyl-accepting chemotaxis protein
MAVKRWNDEMLDELASSTTEVKESVTELRGSVTELRESLTEVRYSIDALRATSQVLLQVVAQNQRKMESFDEEMELLKQRQAESDQRFNILLEEVRYLIRGNQTN